MIAAGKSKRRSPRTPKWHRGFLQMLPLIRRVARYGLRDLKGDDYDDAVQEVIANAAVAYVRLVEQGRADDACGSSLARYAIRHYWEGRRTGTELNVRDVMSERCRRSKGVQIESLHHWDYQEQQWQEVLVEDKHVTPAELAASRVDFPAWLDTLRTRDRQVAETLATGESTGRVARLFGVSVARISQLRRELMASWDAFHGAKELEPAAT